MISVYTKRWGFLIKTLFSLSFLSQSCKTLIFFGNRNIESNNDTLSNAVFPNTWTLVYLLTASSENNCNYQNGFLQLIQYMIMNQMFYFMKHVVGPGGVLKSKLGVGWRMLSFWPRCFIMAVERTGVFWVFFFFPTWQNSETMPLRHFWVTCPTDSLVWCLKWMSCPLLHGWEVEVPHISYAQHLALSVSSCKILISKPVFLQSHKHLEIVHYSCHRNQTLKSLFDLPGNTHIAFFCCVGATGFGFLFDSFFS